MAPINTVQNEGFRKMINTLDKRYTVPSRNYFSNVALPALYTQCRATVETELQAVQHFAATTKCISRLQRWERAKLHGLNPPEEIRDLLLQTHADPEYNLSLWSGYPL
uniref:Uncharacterized protein n=1 Tax=Oreochromis aureus TaxID=47969 RepID=A0A668TV34_OREAU